MRHFISIILAAVILAATPTWGQASDCTPFETLYAQSNLPLPWINPGDCCQLRCLDTTPCFVCTPQGRVRIANFGSHSIAPRFRPGVGLVGPIPSFAGLTFLESLDLSNNALTGNVPDLSGLSSLTSLWLSNASLSGNIDGRLPRSLTTCSLTLNNTNPGIFSCSGNYPAACAAEIPGSGTQTIPTPPCPTSGASVTATSGVASATTISQTTQSGASSTGGAGATSTAQSAASASASVSSVSASPTATVGLKSSAFAMVPGRTLWGGLGAFCLAGLL